MFIKVGDVFNGCMLVQVGPKKGMIINLNSGNRMSDKTVGLYMQDPTTTSLSYGCHFDKDFLFDGCPEVIHQRINIVTPEPQPEKNTDQVSFIRYIRPLDKLGNIDSQKGITFLIQLDYVDREVNFQYSICNGDNFSKDIGQSVAYDRTVTLGGCYTLPLPKDGIPTPGSVSYIVTALFEYIRGNSEMENFPLKDAATICDFYKKSISY